MALTGEQDLCPFVARLVAHSDLSPCDLRALAGIGGHVRHVAAHRDVIDRHRLGSSISMVACGIVGRNDQTRAGKRHIAALNLPGEIIDLSALMLPDRTDAFVAIGDVVMLDVPIASFRPLLAASALIREAMWRESQRMATIVERAFLHNAGRAADMRLANFFCDIAERLGVAGAGRIAFELDMTHDYLADATGLTNVHVCRTLRALRIAGLVVFQSGRVLIPDWSALAQLGSYRPYDP